MLLFFNKLIQEEYYEKILAISIVLIVALALSACGGRAVNDSSSTITRERALEIALDKAGVKQSDICDLDIDLDRERGTTVWEVDFDHGNLEYSYDIDAETGDITKVERERDN